MNRNFYFMCFIVIQLLYRKGLSIESAGEKPNSEMREFVLRLVVGMQRQVKRTALVRHTFHPQHPLVQFDQTLGDS